MLFCQCLLVPNVDLDTMEQALLCTYTRSKGEHESFSSSVCTSIGTGHVHLMWTPLLQIRTTACEHSPNVCPTLFAWHPSIKCLGSTRQSTSYGCYCRSLKVLASPQYELPICLISLHLSHISLKKSPFFGCFSLAPPLSTPGPLPAALSWHLFCPPVLF